MAPTHSNTEISKARPLWEKRTRVGKISKTLTPSIVDPSVAKLPLITARRFVGSSFQRIPDIFSGGGVAAGPVAGGSVNFSVFGGAKSALRGIIFSGALFSPGIAAGV